MRNVGYCPPGRIGHSPWLYDLWRAKGRTDLLLVIFCSLSAFLLLERGGNGYSVFCSAAFILDGCRIERTDRIGSDRFTWF